MSGNQAPEPIPAHLSGFVLMTNPTSSTRTNRGPAARSAPSRRVNRLRPLTPQRQHRTSRLQSPRRCLQTPATPLEPPAAAPRRPLPRIMAIANQKGGVGKTTTAVNLGAALAELGYRVLVVDLDPQGNATTGLGINARNLELSIYDVLLHDVPIEDVIEPTTLPQPLRGARPPSTWPAPRSSWSRSSAGSCGCGGPSSRSGTTSTSSSSTARRRSGCSPSTAWPPPARSSSRSSASTTPWRASASCCATSTWCRATSTPTSSCQRHHPDHVRRPDQAGRAGGRRGPEALRRRVCRNVVPRTVRLSEAPSFGQPIIVFDPILPGRYRLPGAGQGGERWRAAAG